jgi:hypothetical protein
MELSGAYRPAGHGVQAYVYDPQAAEVNICAYVPPGHANLSGSSKTFRGVTYVSHRARSMRDAKHAQYEAVL